MLNSIVKERSARR